MKKSHILRKDIGQERERDWRADWAGR